ncbi:bifunctional riboflavin kinase/FAD synthetase [Pleurocapsales cyanobacterium LEGE 06147]|nr:bifunctional riboflavin kinase/FAD synthetase [Pleurocapsales cyanobacterium LEGE 06147]
MNKIPNSTNRVWVTHSTSSALTPTTVALGKFDGLHRGHQQVIQPILNQVSKLLFANGHTYSTVISFHPHPQEFFTGKPYTLLTPLKEKVQQLQNWGIEQLILLPFNREMAALSPQDFVEKILVQQLHTGMISVGEDFRFGKQRSGTAIDLQAIAAKFGIPVVIIPSYTCEGERISSSCIRQALSEGNLYRAKLLLDHPYYLTGKVVKGQQLSRNIGFPTANIQLPLNKFLPRHGVYAVKAFIVDETTNASPVLEHLLPLGAGVMNISYHPTVNDSYQLLELHLLDWSGDLYGKTLRIQLEEFLRPEQEFSSLQTKKAQMTADCAIASSLLMANQFNDCETRFVA